jgi:hypothetical protein
MSNINREDHKAIGKTIIESINDGYLKMVDTPVSISPDDRKICSFISTLSRNNIHIVILLVPYSLYQTTSVQKIIKVFV